MEPSSKRGRIRLGQPAGGVLEAPFPEGRIVRRTPVLDAGDEPIEPNPALIVTREVIDAVNRHVGETLERELGGFLLGNRYRCPNSGRAYVIVDQVTPARFTESNEVRLSFTVDAWAQLGDELDGKFHGKTVIGWYHSHPRMDVFLSTYDVTIHEERFVDPWTTALVVEPESRRAGFFCWSDGRLNPRTPSTFYELYDRSGERPGAAWSNYGEVPAAGNVEQRNRWVARISSTVAEPARHMDVAAAGPAPSRQFSLIAIGLLVVAAALAGWFGRMATEDESVPPAAIPPTVHRHAAGVLRGVSATSTAGELSLVLELRQSFDAVAVTVNGIGMPRPTPAGNGVLRTSAPFPEVAPGDVIEVAMTDAQANRYVVFARVEPLGGGTEAGDARGPSRGRRAAGK
jgi:proteasome lid subunit RPN8/RPN11